MNVMMEEGRPLMARWKRWIIVPALAWGGILAGLLVPSWPFYLPPGDLGCFLGSIAIAGLAFFRRKKDIVSLCLPIIAVFAFLPQDPRPGLVFQVAYAASLTALVIRLEMRFPE
jgi:hypothetical protein